MSEQGVENPMYPVGKQCLWSLFSAIFCSLGSLLSGHMAQSRGVKSVLIIGYSAYIVLTHESFWYLENIKYFPTSRPTFTCGGNITEESGVIGSQGYPGVYPPNTKCVWRITVSPIWYQCFFCMPEPRKRLYNWYCLLKPSKQLQCITACYSYPCH